MTVSRLDCVRAGMHFPFYAFRGIIFAGLATDDATEGLNELASYYSSYVPAELRKVFVNPSFTLEDLVAAYNKYPIGNDQGELHERQ